MGYGRKLLAGVLAAVMTVHAGAAGGLGVIAAQDGLTGVMQVSPKAGDTASDYTSLQYTLYDDHAEITGCADTAITFVEIPAEIEGLPVTEIGYQAFEKCDKLTNIVIPDSVTHIRQRAFAWCSSLTNITIPDSVKSIEHSVFSGCSELSGIIVSSGNASYTDIDGVLFTKDVSKLVCYPMGKTDTEYVIPDGVTSIEHSAFSLCKNLTEVTIPDSVTNIGESSFYGCTGLTEIVIPYGVTEISRCAFADCQALKNVFLPSSITYIAYEAFRYCTSLEKLTIPNGCKSIGMYAFSDCCCLLQVILPDTITDLGDNAFWRCYALSYVAIPDLDAVRMVGAFTDCDNVTFVEGGAAIPELVNIQNTLEIVSMPSIQRYAIGEAFNPKNMRVGCICTLRFSDGKEVVWEDKVISTDSLTFSGLDDPVPGICTVTASYIAFDTKGSVDFDVTILDAYLISYDANGGEGAPGSQIKYTDKYLPLSWTVPQRYGYTFLGWGSSPTGTVEYKPGSLYNLNMVTTLYALWEPLPTYTISFDANGGEMQLTSQTGYSGETITLSNEVPVREGYRFMGWAVSPSGEAKYQPGQSGTIGQDLTLYAVWTRVYTITYDANGGEGAPDTQSKPEGTYVTISDIIPVRDDYQFIGWSTAPDGAVEYNLGDLYSNDADLTLYAVWATFYYITYNANGGTGAPATQMKYHDLTQVLSSETPTRSGYTFKGWALRPNGHVVYTVKDYYDANAPVTLYAVWQEYCDSCSGSGQKTSKCPACDYTGMIEHYKSCDSCGGDGNITKTVTKTVEKDIPCLFCDETGTEISITLGPITCRTCDGKGYYTKIETTTETVNQPCPRCSGDGELFSHETECTNSNCNNGWIVRTCTSCYGDLSTSATLSSTEMYSYFIEFEVPAFCFAHDTASNLVKSVTRYTFSADGELISGPEHLTDWSSITLKGTTPAEQFSGQSGLHDLVFECTDEYGTMEIPAAASAYIGVKGDANMDGETNAADAAAILVYAAECGASGSAVLYSDTDETMERFAYFLADVNGESTDGGTDSPLDAADAAAVLVYAAAQGSGSDATWEELLGTT